MIRFLLLLVRVFDQLLTSRSSSTQAIIKVSYLQIYCEVVSDLLDPSGCQLSIRERNNEVIGTLMFFHNISFHLLVVVVVDQVYVENLSESVVQNFTDVQRIIERGDVNRRTASTNMNAQSSRSHAAMIIKIFTPDVNDPHINEDVQGSERSSQRSLRESTLVLVDLAGSERSTAIAGDNQEDPFMLYL